MNGSRGFTLGFRLIASFGALLGLVAILGGIAMVTIQGLGGSLDFAVNSSAGKMRLLSEMESGVELMRIHAGLAEISLLNSQNAGKALGEVYGTACTSCHTADRVNSNQQIFENASKDVLRKASEFQSFSLSSKERQALDDLVNVVTAWTPFYQQYLSLAGKDKFPDAHVIMVEQIYPLLQRLSQSSAVLNAEQEAALGKLRRDSDKEAAVSLWRVAIAVVLALLAGLLGLWVVKRVSTTLRSRAEELLEMSAQVAGTAGEISESNESLAQGASEQAASIEETSAATAEIHGATRDNVERTASAAEVIAAEALVAAEADEKLNAALASMKEMVVSSERISRIIRTIDEIAFQTNILALNAAVEAARAGEAGLGFSIVAEEVRNLAKRSAVAAKDTAELVSGSVESSNAASARLEEVTKLVRVMTGRITGVKEQIDEVNQSGQQQARGLDQIAKSMEQMEQLTASTAAQTEERAAASVQLSAQSAALRDVVAGLRSMF